MPRATLKACSGRGGTCPNLIEVGRSRCSECGGRTTPRRPSRSSGIYSDPRWKALSRRTIAEEPICRLQILCDGAPSEVADHIVEIEDGGPPFERSNTQGACVRCNVSKGQRAAQARRSREEAPA